jgi:hypothetical protein
VKIDRSLISDTEGTGNQRAIVAPNIDLSHALHLKVTAEGLETKVLLTILEDMDCDWAQKLLSPTLTHQTLLSNSSCRWSTVSLSQLSRLAPRRRKQEFAKEGHEHSAWLHSSLCTVREHWCLVTNSARNEPASVQLRPRSDRRSAAHNSHDTLDGPRLSTVELHASAELTPVDPPTYEDNRLFE